MSIQRISRLDNLGVFRNFRWPHDLPEFTRFNLIYGWNGTGKTTLSRLLRQVETGDEPPVGAATLRVGDKDIHSSDFPQKSVQVRVFNRDFVDESVFPFGGGDVPPILVVGKDSVDKQKALIKLKNERESQEAALRRARATRQRCEKELDRHCVQRAKLIKDTLRTPGVGRYNEYDKRTYRKQAAEMLSMGNVKSFELQDDVRDTLLLQHRQTIKDRLKLVDYRVPTLESLREEVAAALATTVASMGIEALKGDPKRAEWVRDGWRMHKERESQTCLFCDQGLAASVRDALDEHFGSEYEHQLEAVNRLVTRLKDLELQAQGVHVSDRASFYDHIRGDLDSARLALDRARSQIGDFLNLLMRALEKKRSRVFKRLVLDVTCPEVDRDVVASLNEVIQRHNDASDDFEAQTDSARDRLSRSMITECLQDYSRFEEGEKAASEESKMLQADVERLSRRISDLEREIVEHRRPADELNEDLRKYLGHDELRLDVRDTGYVFSRNGMPAESLSEGERTALALLYFLKSLDDRRFDIKRGVVVMDDPVSSLDANALYLAFGYIRACTQDAGQLFLLTHNFTFLRYVRNWFHHLQGQRKRDIRQRPARFYMLEQVREGDYRCSTIRSLDPLLERYESEYHYLFACVHRGSNHQGKGTLEESYHYPNVARRLLEMFLAFRRPEIAGELWKKLEDVEFDSARKLRIIRFVHTHSHGDAIGEAEHDPSILGESESVLGDLMELIKSLDAEHYHAMVKVSGSGDDGAEDER